MDWVLCQNIHNLLMTFIVCRLANCQLTRKCFETISSVLRLAGSPLRELDLSHNFLVPETLKTLCAGLSSPHCSLDSLNLSYINLEESGAMVLKAVLLGSQTSSLRWGKYTAFKRNDEVITAEDALSIATAIVHWHCHNLLCRSEHIIILRAEVQRLADNITMEKISSLNNLNFIWIISWYCWWAQNYVCMLLNMNVISFPYSFIKVHFMEHILGPELHIATGILCLP